MPQDVLLNHDHQRSARRGGLVCPPAPHGDQRDGLRLIFPQNRRGSVLPVAVVIPVVAAWKGVAPGWQPGWVVD